jgi:hypothetical protein
MPYRERCLLKTCIVIRDIEMHNILEKQGSFREIRLLYTLSLETTPDLHGCEM